MVLFLCRMLRPPLGIVGIIFLCIHDFTMRWKSSIPVFSNNNLFLIVFLNKKYCTIGMCLSEAIDSINFLLSQQKIFFVSWVSTISLFSYSMLITNSLFKRGFASCLVSQLFL